MKMRNKITKILKEKHGLNYTIKEVIDIILFFEILQKQNTAKAIARAETAERITKLEKVFSRWKDG